MLLLMPMRGAAQITIKGNVYGGGNEGKVNGSTNVTVKQGDLNKVFGGSRMADVGGHAYVNIDGKNATGYTVINYVFGGNDIAGHIGTAATLPTELEGNKDGVDNTWNTFVHLSTKTTTTSAGVTTEAADAKKTFIGQVFAGGNGDYYYRNTPEGEGKVRHDIYEKEEDATPLVSRVTDEDDTGFTVPEVDKAYLDVQGGTIVYAYGGGNNATVKEKTAIHVDNPSTVVTEILVNEDSLEVDEGGTDLLTDERIRTQMNINQTFTTISSEDFQVGRLFGGNNKAEMAIMPSWNLQRGQVRNLYSGGNKGMMTSPKGLLLEIVDTSRIVVDNLFGGCRMADVRPTVNGEYTPTTNLEGYKFPAELSARVLVRGGNINNVYGGNDVTGMVYGGNAIGIYTTIRGNVYGGGNGAYAYTDIETYRNDSKYGDFFYSTDGYASSVDALNAFRPNAEQVSIRLKGTDAEHPTVIRGSVFCGGNCATLKTAKAKPLVELKMGSHVIADSVYLGNNGARLVDEDILKHYAGTYEGAPGYSSLNLTDPSVFKAYMEGAAMNLMPNIVFDRIGNGDPADYEEYTSKIGSFFCGGNKGSMTVPGKNTFTFDHGLVLFERLVGGCNNADVTATELNAAYEGGILGSEEEQEDYTEVVDGKKRMKDRLELNLENIVMEPRRWNDAGTALEWNTQKWNAEAETPAFEKIGTDDTADDKDRRLVGGNVYGGCYNSGHVNGNVIININEDIIKTDNVFAEPEDDDEYEIKPSGKRNSGVLRSLQLEDLTALSMTIFGAGYGEQTEIWGNTTVNLNKGYAFQIFGGGEKGVVGKKNDSGKYEFNAAYGTTVNMKGDSPGYAYEESGPALAEAEYIYGGGNEGDVCGNTLVNLGNGRLYGAFGGASNANIYGGTEMYVGHNGGFPWIGANIYGGNDFGGIIKGKINHTTITSRETFDASLLQSSTYVKYIQGRVDSIFGGNYGSYDYKDRIFDGYTDESGLPLEGFSFPKLAYNSFVFFNPANNNSNKFTHIFGGSEGYPGNVQLNNTMQKDSYVLVDDTDTKDEDRYIGSDIFGGGAFAGVGTADAVGSGRSVVDLYAGKFHNVYGGCSLEGLVGYTRVNVPSASTANVNAIFGGGKGYDISLIEETPELAARYCDHYVTSVDYKSKNAIVRDAIYGGNENCRIAADTYVNIEAPVRQNDSYQATVYGAGYGRKTVSGRTNVFMNNGSNAYKVFGGGRDGNTYNYPTLRKWLYAQSTGTPKEKSAALSTYAGLLNSFKTYVDANPISLPDRTGTYANSSGVFDGTYTNDLLPIDEYHPLPDYYNTNVHILDGGNVSGYAYGGGLGSNAVVSGTTYVELKGGNVDRDIYGGGQGGPVFDEFKIANDGMKDFQVTTNVHIEGGMVRNVYGGGYQGHVGSHRKTVAEVEVDADISDSYSNDLAGVTNVVIGKKNGTSFTDGVPAILRNAYGGGEGGSVYGTTNLTINNGYIGYRYKNIGTSSAPDYKYVEELDDQKPNAIELAGNAFGGGYVVNSYVDVANINMFGGTVRGCLYGGGEVGPIGRGTMKADAPGGLKNNDATIYKAGQTHVKMYNGHVLRNVFGGGRGKDSWGGDGTMYMDKDLVATLDLNCKGFVFGQTDVCIYGGEVGTVEGMADNYGNVFGGCDEGSVYSAYEKADGTLCMGKKDGVRYGETEVDKYQGYYYKYEDDEFVEHDVDPSEKVKMERMFTEDCKVLVEPWLQVKSTPVVYDEKTYNVGDYVPTDYLNTLKAKAGSAWPSEWDNVDVGTPTKERGIIIHNAVFAGGNVAAGSSSMYANVKTVFGNATASIHDIYNRDMITIGTGHTGGLYGDGNLTFVDGYRELNITNYGTDKYHLISPLTIEEYKLLPEREQAYYEPKYECAISCTDNAGTTYTVGSSLPYDELIVLFLDDYGNSLTDNGTPNGTPIMFWNTTTKKWIPNDDYWKEKGVVSTYAGRIMNTIQRADFCGVFGSRMVMKGAQDRVPEKVDYTNYTINRVREVSLNKMLTPAGDTDPDNVKHGNYFGIYSNVNVLGALTSDVAMESVRTTSSSNPELQPNSVGQTYEQWKSAHVSERKRNNGSCHNQLALASGVYLELTTEKSTGNTVEKKDWGLITGVVELDLINVQPGVGGGFVYAKNEHGVRTPSNNKTTTLTALNDNAVTQWDFTYSTNDETKKEWETSGNFIHYSQTIIDDCYNISNRYKGASAVKAHYWFISGQVFVYDQYISAYTGTPNAYSEVVEMPITINAASHGTMTLMDVQPNRYAYYSSYTNETTNTPLSGDQKLVIKDETYQLNSPISYWDWNKLSASEKKLFVEDTYVTTSECTTTVGTAKYPAGTYPAGTVLLKEDYDALRLLHKPSGGDVVSVYHTGKQENVDFDFVFRSSNNLSHDTGYLLTYNVTNPVVWDQWYTQVNSDARTKNQVGGDGYTAGPTYHPTTNNLYGQKEYKEADIIPQTIYNTYQSAVTDNKLTLDGQATFGPAYIVTAEYTNGSQHYYPGAAVASVIAGYTSPAYVCTSTIQLSESEFIYVNELMTESQKTTYYNRFKDGSDAEKQIASDINTLVVPAYYCTKAGLYGGDYYESGKNYRALNAWSAMSGEDREHFKFNYDALDLLIDPAYSGNAGRKYQYDSSTAATPEAVRAANAATYSLATPIDYMATYNGDTDATPHNDITLTKDKEYTRTEYEQLPNERRHYAPVSVEAAGDYYVVKNDFVHIETPYATGATLTSEELARLTDSERAANIDTLTFSTTGTYYYCRESYKVNEKTEGVGVTDVMTSTAYDLNQTVPVGTVINSTDYGNLKDYQRNFTIHGVSPMETSTLYVSRNSDINDLSTEKIITVIYKYDYEESDATGMHITPVSERHVVNIHINFKSGVPTIEDIQQPNIVLPGTSLTMRVPTVKPGAYEILGGGWELFEKVENAESHSNGVEYAPSRDSLYWYQDGFYLAYYAKTYLGRTYSNHVPVSVANYHDLKDVMNDKKYHLHVDYDRTRLKRDSKIYINDYSSSSQNGADLLKDLYDLTLVKAGHAGYTVSEGTITATESPANTHLTGHALLNNSTETGENIYDKTTNTRGVRGGTNLDFFLRSDIHHPESWTPIASIDTVPCFNGTLHGDGHTISGLDHSLFGKLCGSVYNLGVMGSFTSSGVADSGDGYVESCWVKTSGTPADGVKAVFGGNPAVSYEQTVNSYYPVSNAFTSGKAKAMSDQAFYNGEVAYDLNNFYLYKRYCDREVSTGLDKQNYRYFTIGDDDKLTLHSDKYYADHAPYCSSGYNGIQYVEERFADGDFRFAAGSIPVEEDERNYVENIITGSGVVQTSNYYPIWPDDYFFFGQKLTYGYALQPHDSIPSAIVRDNGRLSKNGDANRVYRAPAYYRSNVMGVAHFNPQAYLAAKSSDGTKVAYPNMTAIDFAGHGDTHDESTKADKHYGLATVGGSFYPPLLDDGGLLSINSIDETKNLLVYAPAATNPSGYANKQTYDVLTSYFEEPAFADYYDNAHGYRKVTAASAASVYGHIVKSDRLNTGDHLLVDKQDFNAPYPYTFASGKRMWYQRLPEDNEYVNRTQGWQGISIPFAAELVTTNDKGEITHFYRGSDTSKNGTDTKIGHEYWLREFNGIKTEGEPLVAKATFRYPNEADADPKEVTNTFLWDYYYVNTAAHNHKDKNDDSYQTYYQSARTYTGYPLLANGTPYILGLPGSTYYEFDLSGKFTAQNTAVAVDKLGKQTITFASAEGATIGVSASETLGVTHDGYTFMPTYMSQTITAGSNAYTLSATGNSYDKVPGSGDAVRVEPFRPYFVAAAPARQIVFDDADDQFVIDPNDPDDPSVEGGLTFRIKRHAIVTVSNLRQTADVQIYSPTGQVEASFTIEPGQTIETKIRLGGVYIIRAKDGRIVKKVVVK